MKKSLILCAVGLVSLVLAVLTIGCSQPSKIKTDLDLVQAARSYYLGSHRGVNARSAYLWSGSRLAEDLPFADEEHRSAVISALQEIDHTFNVNGLQKQEDRENLQTVRSALDEEFGVEVEEAGHVCAISAAEKQPNLTPMLGQTYEVCN